MNMLDRSRRRRIWFFLKPKTWLGILQALNEQVPNSIDLLCSMLKAVVTNVAIPFLALQISLSYFNHNSNAVLEAASQVSAAAAVGTSSSDCWTLFPPFIAMQPLHVLHLILKRREGQQFYSSHGNGSGSGNTFTSLNSRVSLLSSSSSSLSSLPPSPFPPIQKLAIATFLSPFTMGTFEREILPKILIFVNRIKLWKALRIQPDEAAVQCLLEGIRKNDIARTKSFDIYFPPHLSLSSTMSYSNSNSNLNSNSNDDKHNDNNVNNVKNWSERQKKMERQKGLLLLPGAFIDHTSYSQIARQIADRGLIVVVVSMEPLRLALKNLGADVNRIRHIIDSVDIEWVKKLKQLHNYNHDCSVSHENTNRNANDDHKLIEWSIGGHSYGAYAAMRLSSELKELLVSKQRRQIKLKLLIWAAGNIDRFVPDLSNFDGGDMEALVVLGSNDAYCNFGDGNGDVGSVRLGSALHLFLSKLPPVPKCTIIQGGTHNNFASYGGLVEYNGVPGISRERQHQMVVRATTNFLFS